MVEIFLITTFFYVNGDQYTDRSPMTDIKQCANILESWTDYQEKWLKFDQTIKGYSISCGLENKNFSSTVTKNR